jgi:hypothetical protein
MKITNAEWGGNIRIPSTLPTNLAWTLLLSTGHSKSPRAPPKLKARSAPFSAAAAAEPEQQEPQLPRFPSTVVLAFSSSVRYFYKGKTGPAPKVLWGHVQFYAENHHYLWFVFSVVACKMWIQVSGCETTTCVNMQSTKTIFHSILDRFLPTRFLFLSWHHHGTNLFCLVQAKG